MLLTLQVLAVLLTAVAMSLSLAHALELPGKRRLSKEAYLTVQKIYYPGFTIGGFGEFLALAALLALVLSTPSESAAFGWTLGALLALLAMHAAYWLLTHPVNKFWLADHELKGLGAGFFGIGGAPAAPTQEDKDTLWRRYRDRWEMSHVVRAVLGGLGLALLAIAVAL